MKPNFAASAVYNLDNLEVMRGMDSATVRLIYADPPNAHKGRAWQPTPTWCSRSPYCRGMGAAATAAGGRAGL